MVGRIEGQDLEEGRKDTLAGTSVKISSVLAPTLRSCGTFSSFLCVVKITPSLFVCFCHKLYTSSERPFIALCNKTPKH